MTPENWAVIRGLVDWLDEDSPVKGELSVAMRLGKVGEEFGEAWAAYIGVMGQNPRKGRTHTPADVADELCDVIVTAAVALHLFASDPAAHLDAKLKKIATRVNVQPAAVPADVVPPLTARHVAALRLVANGNTAASAGRALGLTKHGAISILAEAYRLLGVHDRAHAVAVAMRLGLLRPDEVRLPAGMAAPVDGSREAA